jgi:hypothetical protein
MDSQVGSDFVEAFITEQLGERLANEGFRPRNRNEFLSRAWGEAEAQIRCVARQDRSTDSVVVSLLFGLRFEQLEILLHPDDQHYPTIVCTTDSLSNTGELTEVDAGVTEAARLLHRLVLLCGTRFFDKYSNLNALLRTLENNERPFEFSMDPLQRVMVLAAIRFTRGESERSLLLIDNELVAREKEFAWGPRLELKRLRQRLARGA